MEKHLLTVTCLRVSGRCLLFGRDVVVETLHASRTPLRYGALNLMFQCVPSQKGLFFD